MKKIFLTQKGFDAQSIIKALKDLSNLLSICSNYLSTESWFGPKVESKNIEKFIKKFYFSVELLFSLVNIIMYKNKKILWRHRNLHCSGNRLCQSRGKTQRPLFIKTFKF